MEKIKTVKIGRKGLTSLSIVLPKTWIEDLNICAGDKIDIHREGERLIITSQLQEVSV